MSEYFIGMAIILITIVLSVFKFMRPVIDAYKLRTSDVTTLGMVTRRWSTLKTVKNWTTSYHISYCFKAMSLDNRSKEIIHKQLVSKSHYNSLKVGNTISVRYLPDNPKTSKALLLW